MKKDMSKVDMRDAVFEEIYELAKCDRRVVFLTSDMGAFTLTKFREEMPDQFYNLGIAEQNMINVASGLALAGKIVFVHSLIPFAIMRCFEQIKTCVSAMNLNVNIVGGGPGFTYENDGPSHHGLEDIACMRTLENIRIYNPSDSFSASNCVKKMYKFDGPTYIRMDKGIWPQIYGSESVNKEYVFCHGGNDTLIVTSGTLGNNAYSFFKEHENNTSYLNLLRIDHVEDFMKEDITCFSAINLKEENVEAGGLSEIISKIFINQSRKIELTSNSAHSQKNGCPYGTREYLLEQDKLLYPIKGTISKP